MHERFGVRLILTCVVCWLTLTARAWGQPQTQFPSSNLNWAPPGTTPLSGLNNSPPQATLGAPQFDAFGTGGASGAFQAPAPVVAPQQWPGGNSAIQASPLLNGTEPYPSQAPPSLFPNGLPAPQINNLGLRGPSMRFLQAPRLRHTWLHGDNGDDLQINDTDVSLVFAWPNYLFTNQPLYVVPSFSVHSWDGPDNRPPGNMADLPGSAYSAFLDAGWESSPEAALGAEFGGRVGVFSDFSDFVSDSLRVQGKGLLRLRLTPTVQLRGGIYFVDRLRLNLLPVGGILWTPNPQTRFDIYFPNPKLSQYMTTVGNQELWWYVAGEYGGGSWTVRRAVNNRMEQVDLNDIRVMMGIEFGPSRFFARGRRVGFFEVGWVTDREILYRDRPQDDLTLDDTIMLRAGIGY